LKSKKYIKQLIIRISAISFGLFINGIGLALLYSVELGSSPMGTFADGLHNLLHVSQGNANIFANAAFLVVLLIFARKYISVGTVLCTFTLGLYVNLASAVIAPLNMVALPFLSKIVISAAGTLLMGVGLGIYVAVGFGLGPLEAIVDIIYQHSNLKYKTAKIIFDALLGILGILFGGKIGIGTVVSILCTGIVMDAIIGKAKPFWTKVLS
jgi:uncharacterized protein